MDMERSIDTTESTTTTLHFSMTIQQQDDPEFGSYETYGMKVLDDSGSLIEEWDDLCLDQAALLNFIERCNRGNVSRIHIEDLVEDFLADPYF